MAENTGAAAVAEPVDNSPSLLDWVGEQYGDFSEPTTAEPESDAGTPPPSTPDPADRSEGADASVPPGDTPALADDSGRPDLALTATTPDDDPLDGSTPLPYVVDGESRTFDGITVLKNGGAIIDPEAVAKVQRILGERDHLYAKDQTAYREHQDLLRLTAWPSKNADGTPRTLAGREGLEAQRVMLADSLARNRSTWAFLDDPEKLTTLVTIEATGRQYQDGTPEYAMVPNRAAIEAFKRNVTADARDIVYAARQHFQASTVPQPAPDAPVSDHALPTINQIAADHQIAGLTDADKQFLAKQFALYVKATPQGRVVDPLFVDVIKDRAVSRAEQTKIASAASGAAKANTAKLAAASAGRAGKSSPKIVVKPEPERTREDDFDEAWNRRQRAASGAIRAHTFGQ